MHTDVFKAFRMLVSFHLYLWRGDFSALHDKVRAFPVTQVSCPARSVAEISDAVDLASIWYPKQVLCLQRSAATACLLKHYGHPAQMVLGVRMAPFRAHAWVEVDGRVVNDKPYVPEMYAVLDRC